jgi:hypothetical protein
MALAALSDSQASTTPTTPLIFPLGGSIPPAFQLLAADIPSSSTRPMFQFAFDTTTEDQLGWDQMGLGNILTTLDALQQTEEVGPSQLTHAPVRTQPTQPQGGATPAAGGATPVGRATVGGATPAGGGTPNAAGSSHAAMATLFPDQLGPRVVRAPDLERTIGTTPGLALELLGRRGTDAFRCSTTFTMILYKLFASTR